MSAHDNLCDRVKYKLKKAEKNKAKEEKINEDISEPVLEEKELVENLAE